MFICDHELIYGNDSHSGISTDRVPIDSIISL
jgi:hypothetical protein